MTGLFILKPKLQKKLYKFFSFVAIFSLFLQAISGIFYVKPTIAEEEEKSAPVVEQPIENPQEQPVETPQEQAQGEAPVEITPTSENNLTPEVPLTPTPTENNTQTQESNLSLDLEKPVEEPVSGKILPTPTPIEKVCLTESQQIIDTTNDSWEINLEESWAKTKEPVKLGVKYLFPQENKVSVTFKCLPKEGTTQLKIQKVKISDLKLPEGTNPYGEWAYEITTEMQDGTFEYDVTLPKPENKEVKVLYMEDSKSEVKDIEQEKINQEGDKVKVESLDHFTIYVVTVSPGGINSLEKFDNLTNWSTNNASATSGSGEDTPLDGNFAKIGNGGYICRDVDATGFQNLLVEFYWKGDKDTEWDDNGYVYVKNGGTCSDGSGWTEVYKADLDTNRDGGGYPLWSSLVERSLGSSFSNSTFKIKFKNSSNESNEFFRIDNFRITGTKINWPSCDWLIPNCHLDPTGESGIGNDRVDLDGPSSNKPAASFKWTDDYLYLRFRVDGNPGTAANPDNFAWSVLVQNTPPKYQYLITLDGLANQVKLLENNQATALPISWDPIFNDPAETLLWSGPSSIYANIIHDTSTIDDHYIILAVPINALSSSINSNSIFYFVTATDINNFNKDYLNCYNYGAIKVTKDVVPNDNSLWNFTISGPGGTYNINNLGDGQSQTVNNLIPGSYNIVETISSNYSTTVTCGGVGPLSQNSFLGTIVVGQTLECTFINTRNPYCGDGLINQASERCDNGGQNGQVCTPPYGGACDYCDTSCQIITLTGPYCGDGIKNGSEECDGDDLGGLPNSDFTCNNRCQLELIQPKVTICHATSSHTNPYNVQQPNKSGDVSGHDGHNGPIWYPGITVDWGDIIPPFYYLGGYYSGKNWTTEGQAVWNNNCTFPSGTITFIKDAQPDSSQTFSFTYASNEYPIGNFSLTDDGNGDDSERKTFSAIPAGVYSWSEDFVSGWTLSNIQCSEDKIANSTVSLATRSVNIVLESGENVTCTFTNTRDTGTLKVKKNVDLNGDGDYNDPNETNNTTWKWQYNGGANQNTGAPAITVPTGEYVLTETMKEGFHFVSLSCTGGVLNGNTVTVNKGANVVCTFKNARDTGTITIIKDAINNSEENFYFDTNPGFPGGDFELEDDGNPYNGGTPEQRTFRVPVGNYWIDERDKAGWKLTNLVCSGDDNINIDLASGRVEIDLDKDENVVCTYTNTKLAKVWGFKFNDKNANGYWNPLQGELGLGNWRIFLDEGNGLYDGTEPNTFTSDFPTTRGYYEFNHLLPGNYSVCEELQSGWTNTKPLCQSVNLTPGDVDFVNFGNVKYGSISGTKYHDINGNRQRDHDEGGSEPGLSGWTIELKNMSDQVLRPFTTDEKGDYWFDKLLPGTYKVCEEDQAGWLQTSTPTCYVINVNGDDHLYNDFGNFQVGQMTICKYDDYDGDGVKDENEAGIAGVNVKIQKKVEEGEVENWEDVYGWGVTKSDGCYTWSELGPGIYRAVEDLTDSELAGYFPTDSWTTEGDYRVSDELKMTSGGDFKVDFFNDLNPISLSLSKTHNKVGSTASRGEILNFTLKVKNTALSTAYGVLVKDVLPDGFSYVTGTAKVDGVVLEPTVAGQQLTWSVGNILADQEITITYDVLISISQNEGGYPNVAIAYGTNRPAGSDDNSTSYSNFAFVYTAVGIGISYTVSVGGGAVLGAATGQVLGAATGSPTTLLITAILMILAGLAILLIKRGKKYHV